MPRQQAAGIMILKCHTGLAGRVTALANGLAAAGELEFHWFVNHHCPLNHTEVFPHGIPGVRFVVGSGIECITMRGGRSMDRYQDTAADFYQPIMNTMAGEAWTKPDTSICARFWRHPSARIEPLIEAARHHGTREVFVMADTRRREIARLLTASGISPILPRSAELISDYARERRNTLLFLSDWKTMLAAKRIITHPEHTGLIHPTIAACTAVFDSSTEP